MKALFMSRFCLLIFIFALNATAHAENMQRTIIELQHIQAKQVVPLIQPFVVENGNISAEGNSVILETTEENMQQVKILIHELDIPVKQLQISVSLDPDAVFHMQEQEKAGTTIPDANPTDNIKPAVTPDHTLVYKTKGREISPGVQVIKVLQNHWSMIRTGQSIPVRNQIRNPDGTITESISYQQLNQGLRIKPQLSGQKVRLSVQPFYEAANQTGPGKKLYFKQEKVANTILGSWVGLEATTGVPIPVDNNWVRQNQYAADPIPLIFLKVDIAP